MHISHTIFDISIQFKLCRYCITGLMYHDMAIYRYIVASLVAKHSPRQTFPLYSIINTVVFTSQNLVWNFGQKNCDYVFHLCCIITVTVSIKMNFPPSTNNLIKFYSLQSIKLMYSNKTQGIKFFMTMVYCCWSGHSL